MVTLSISLPTNLNVLKEDKMVEEAYMCPFSKQKQKKIILDIDTLDKLAEQRYHF